MRRTLIGLTAAGLAAGSLLLGAGSAQAAPPPKQCFGVLPCDGPIGKAEEKVRKVIETCQYAYCQLP